MPDLAWASKIVTVMAGSTIAYVIFKYRLWRSAREGYGWYDDDNYRIGFDTRDEAEADAQEAMK